MGLATRLHLSGYSISKMLDGGIYSSPSEKPQEQNIVHFYTVARVLTHLQLETRFWGHITSNQYKEGFWGFKGVKSEARFLISDSAKNRDSFPVGPLSCISHACFSRELCKS